MSYCNISTTFAEPLVPYGPVFLKEKACKLASGSLKVDALSLDKLAVWGCNNALRGRIDKVFKFGAGVLKLIISDVCETIAAEVDQLPGCGQQFYVAIVAYLALLETEHDTLAAKKQNDVVPRLWVH